MDEQIKELNQKVDKLQASLDYMMAKMWATSNKNMLGEEIVYTPGSFIGGGALNTIIHPDGQTEMSFKQNN